MPAETLMVTCRECGQAFAAPDQVDRTTLEAMVLSAHYECLHCGAEATYVKSDHFFRLDVGTTEPER